MIGGCDRGNVFGHCLYACEKAVITQTQQISHHACLPLDIVPSTHCNASGAN
ncbi:hypothetical protein SAMN02982996_00809 [Lonsdalea quercina]|uniref:Uncharacterized protein n=1 Tax=Lonsdalea quercina TaxID=71657 RepID=A0A1H3XX69_9GAMM|nr:hypothetical protein SAMN02982996_00809 [Lonsdalea quercina]